MHKDPVERERQFRQSIESYAVARQTARSRRLRPWLGWLESLAHFFFKHVGLSLSLVVVLGFGNLFLFIFGFHIKWTNAYACSLAQARLSPTVIAELGEPVTAGFFAWSFSYFQGGSVTDAFFKTALRGPKGDGTLYVRWYSAPVGSSLQMELLKDGRKYPVYSGTAQCP